MLVSVIIPSYNYGRFLPDSLDSVLGQTKQADEIIVVDDGSTDETPDIVRPFLKDSRLRYIRTENQGVSSARNLGIFIAKGRFIALLDADDLWHPRKLELQLPLFQDPEVGIVFSLIRVFDDNGLINKHEQTKAFRGCVLCQLLLNNFICPSSVVIRKECVIKAGYFDRRLSQGEDLDLWLRLAAEGFRFDYIPEALVDFRLGGDASTSRHWDKRFEDNQLMLETLFSNAKYRGVISAKMQRQAWAALWRKRGYLLLERKKRLEALIYGIASLIYDPLNRMALGVAARCLLPLSIQNRIRK